MVRFRVIPALVAVMGLGAALGCGRAPNIDVDGASPRSNASDERGPAGTCGTTPDGLPPTPPCDQVAPIGTGRATFAIKQLFLGDTDWGGTPDAINGWKQFGFNLDGEATTAESANTCKPVSGGVVEPDGIDGIDNSFGHNVAPLVENLGVGSSTLDNGIAAGTFTLMLDVQGLGTGDAYGPLLTRLYAGKGATPPLRWDGTDSWQIVPELLSNPEDPSSTLVSFPASFLVNDVWVSGPRTDVTLVLTLSGLSVNLALHSAMVSMTLDPTHTNATRGVIAGVLETQAFTAELANLIGYISPAFRFRILRP